MLFEGTVRCSVVLTRGRGTGGDFGSYWTGVLTGTGDSSGGRRRRSAGWVLEGTGVCDGCGTAEGGAWQCGRAQARTCPVSWAATSARRAPGGSRPRRSAAPRPPPRARPRIRRSWGPSLAPRGAATTPSATTHSSTRTRSATAALATSCCAPPSRPVRCRARRFALCGDCRYGRAMWQSEYSAVLTACCSALYSHGMAGQPINGTLCLYASAHVY